METVHTCTVIRNLKSASLLSVAKLCDNKKMVVFDRDKVNTITHNPAILVLVSKQHIVLQGHCNRQDSLWHTTLSSTKAILQKDIFKSSPVYLGLYYRKLKSHNTQSVTRTLPSPLKKRSFKKYHCNYITGKRLKHILNMQQQCDKPTPPQYAFTTIYNPKLQVIIQKNPNQKAISHISSSCSWITCGI